MDVRALRAGSVAEVGEVIGRLRSEGFVPTLAVAFASISHDLEALRETLANAGLDVFGASSAGEMMVTGRDGERSDEAVATQSIVVMFLALDRAAYRIRLFDEEEQSPDAIGERIGAWARDAYAQPALVVMPAGLFFDAEPLVQGIERAAGAAQRSQIPIFGGKAGDDWKLGSPVVFDRDRVADAAVAVLCFDGDRVAVRGVAASGWQAVGAERTVTRAEGNAVHTIDGIPTQHLYREYLGPGAGTEIPLIELPLQVAREGYAVLRAPLMAAPDSEAILFSAPIAEGSRVRFSMSPGEQIIDASLEAMGALHAEAPSAQALLLFSCVCRHAALGPMAEDEVVPMQQLWDVPLIGLYAYGEIGRNDIGRCDYFNDTLVLVALEERKAES